MGVLFGTRGQQQFEGIATYRSALEIKKFDIDGGPNLNPEMQESIRKQLMQSSQKEYKLKFNIQESVWKEEAKLDPVSPPSSNSGMQIRFAAGNPITYMNPGKNEFLEETELFGKKFLIEDELKAFNWKVTNETKKIGNYTVIKAEYERIRESTSLSLNDSEQKTMRVMDTTLVTAWYTPDIPVSQGPDGSWGLPGLILELKNGSMSYLCTKIELNPADPVIIDKPSKGKRISREESEKIRHEKLQEMMKKYDTGDGGTRKQIRIGG